MLRFHRLFKNNQSALKIRAFSTKPDNVFSSPKLCGSCDCGKVGFEANGVSCGNFYTHSSAPRYASSSSEPEASAYLASSAFKLNQVSWKGNPINSVENPAYMPPGSSNPHYFCPCEKKQYLGVDATRWLGVVLLNQRRVKGFPESIPDNYRPNHHVFYGKFYTLPPTFLNIYLT